MLDIGSHDGGAATPLINEDNTTCLFLSLDQQLISQRENQLFNLTLKQVPDLINRNVPADADRLWGTRHRYALNTSS